MGVDSENTRTKGSGATKIIVSLKIKILLSNRKRRRQTPFNSDRSRTGAYRYFSNRCGCVGKVKTIFPLIGKEMRVAERCKIRNVFGVVGTTKENLIRVAAANS